MSASSSSELKTNDLLGGWRTEETLRVNLPLSEIADSFQMASTCRFRSWLSLAGLFEFDFIFIIRQLIHIELFTAKLILWASAAELDFKTQQNYPWNGRWCLTFGAV